MGADRCSVCHGTCDGRFLKSGNRGEVVLGVFLKRIVCCSFSRVVLDGEVLSADHAVSLEPLAAELLGGTVGRVGPLDRDTVVVGVLQSVGEGVARDGDEGGLLGVEHSGSAVDAESLHVGGLEGPSDTASGRVGHLDVVGVLVIVGGVEDDLGAGLGGDISGRDGLSHVDDLVV
ncbi:hypothetical protein PFISCL1PPCAC_29110, partial [Pristionchus fissidentatus]